jgi:hypothetical protein
MGRRAARLPVPPLSDHAWSAIEAGVFQQLDRGLEPISPPARRGQWSSFALPFAAVAAAAGVALAFGLSRPNQGSRAPEVALLDPAPSEAPSALALADDHSLSDAPDPELRQHIITTTGATTASFGDSLLSIANHSDLRISGSEHKGWRVLLEEGEARFDVTPRPGRPEFTVEAGEVTVRVVGTNFDVRRQDGITHVAVHRGRVRVEHLGQQAVLDPGDTWTEPESIVDSEPAPPARGMAPRQRKRPSARQEFEEAASLESTAPDQALSKYRRISDAGGPWAANALYARARLMREQGRQAAAEQLLVRYLERYPRGNNAADARRLLKK